MPFARRYLPTEPEPAAIAAEQGLTLLEFGAPWCGICLAAQPAIEAALASHPELRHVKIEDGRGRALGRAFKVKLWPTLVLLRDGQELARRVRPDGRTEIDSLLSVAAG